MLKEKRKKKGKSSKTEGISKGYKDQHEGVSTGQIWNNLCIKMNNEVIDNILDNKGQSEFTVIITNKK